MTTDKFTKDCFEQTLNHILQDDELKWVCKGLIAGEFRYEIPANDMAHGKVFIEVSSSIGPSGIADGTGENSIRVHIHGSDGLPLGNKIQRWITRVPGWEGRLEGVMFKMIDMAQSISWCTKCSSMEKIFVVKKEGPNKGRLFIKCNCPNSFEWLDEYEEEETPKAAKETGSPNCPKCGGMMVLRNRKDGSGQFWGCRLYPACNGARDVEVSRSILDLKKEQEFAAEIQQLDRLDQKKAEDDKYAMEQAMNAAADLKKTIIQQKAAPVEKPRAFEPSKYQLAIFNWITKKLGNHLVVEACPGSGKTRTGVELLKLLSRDEDVAFVTFNAHIQKDIAKKAPRWVKVMTYHALGFAACRQAFGNNIILDTGKVDAILETLLERETWKHIYPTIRQLVSLVKANLVDSTDEELNNLVEYHGIELNGDQEIIFNVVRQTLYLCKENTSVIDYDDQCWLPIILNLPMHKYSFIVVDEAQDTNRNQIALALGSVKEDGRIIAFGDRHQSLYGFRGADAEAMENLIAELNADTLPLSITYRCPKSVVALLNEKFPDIAVEAAPWAEEGAIRSIFMENALTEFAGGDMVLCRTNAPLVEPVFALIRHGIKATIRGRDIGKGLKNLVSKQKCMTLNELLEKLSIYRDAEVAKLMYSKKGSQAQALQDKVDTIIALADGISSITALENRIESIFSDGTEGCVFSSIHRAKGLEAKRVYILRPDLLPHPMATKPWELKQEVNCEFVALSRTMLELAFVTE